MLLAMWGWLKSGFIDNMPQAIMVTGRLYDEATVCASRLPTNKRRSGTSGILRCEGRHRGTETQRQLFQNAIAAKQRWRLEKSFAARLCLCGASVISEACRLA